MLDVRGCYYNFFLLIEFVDEVLSVFDRSRNTMDFQQLWASVYTDKVCHR